MSQANIKIAFTLNGKKVSAEVEPELLLVDLLRDRFGLTGTKIGCGEGDCGACTIIMDGKTATSCIIPAARADGTEILTIEGMADGDKLDPVQEAFVETGAVQCGFCIPGMVLSAKALLDGNPSPSRADIKDGLAGNLCRCTGYKKIVEAVEKAAGARQGRSCNV